MTTARSLKERVTWILAASLHTPGPGGREAMMMSQRFPTYFDGIVAGAPAMRTGYSNLGDKWVLTAIDTIAPKDSAGHALGSQAFSEADRKLIVDSVLKQCDVNDGLPDGTIQDPVGCHFDPAVLTCSATKHDDCLSADKVAALAKGFDGPRDSLGRQVYPGFFFDTGIGVGSGFIQGLLAGAPGPLGAAPPLSMDVDREAAVVAANPLNVGDTGSWTNLTTFAGHGGKLIFFHGVSDPWFSAKDTIRYYDQLAADNGGQQQTAQWSRLFLVPGMGHCGGGPATRSIDSICWTRWSVGWRKAPRPRRSRQLGAHFRDAADPYAPIRGTLTTREAATRRTPTVSSVAAEAKSGLRSRRAPQPALAAVHCAAMRPAVYFIAKSSPSSE